MYNQSEGYATSAPSQVAPVIVRTEEIGKGLLELEERIKLLKDRLSPALRPIPKVAGEKQGNPLPPKSPLMHRLDTLEGQIQNCIFAVNDLMGELDI